MIAARIHAFLRAGGPRQGHVRVGPFLIRLTPGTTHPMMNYAVPDDDCRPSHAEVGALIGAFQQRGLLPRLEYVSGAAPVLEGMLHAEGFATEAHLPIMTCAAGEARLIEPSPDFELVLARTDEDHADSIMVADEAYGEPARRSDVQMIKRRRRAVQAGGVVVLAWQRPSAVPAGSGLFPAPREGVTELAAVGTAMAFRKRGVASSVTSRLAREAFGVGVHMIWLTPEHSEAERIYAKVGFSRSEDHMVHISRRQT